MLNCVYELMCSLAIEHMLKRSAVKYMKEVTSRHKMYSGKPGKWTPCGRKVALVLKNVCLWFSTNVWLSRTLICAVRKSRWGQNG